MAEKAKVTMMLLKVDLQCSKCYKKTKKVLSKFPQIQDQMYDEKKNTVIIKVAVCCSPEKIRDEICYRGGGSIKSIEILKPPEKPAPKPVEKLKDQKPADPPKLDKPKVTFDLPPAPVATQAPGYPPPLGHAPVGYFCTDCYEGRGGRPYYEQPVRYYDGYSGRPVYDSWGGGGGGYRDRGYGGSRCSEYLSEENPQGCTII